MSDDDSRILTIADSVTSILIAQFGHSAEESRSLFNAFHAYYSATGGWEPADYYDHEGPQAIALEIEYNHQFPELDRQGLHFLDWRQNQWK